jgi:hypothetical protein
MLTLISYRDEFDRVDASRLEFLAGVAAGVLDQLARGPLRGGENAFVPLEQREARVERLHDVAKICGRGRDSAVRRRRSLRDDAKRRDAKLAENGFESETEIGFRVRMPTQPDTEDCEGIADPLGDALLIEGSHSF